MGQILSVTRFRLRSWGDLPSFLWKAFQSVRQSSANSGLIHGKLGIETSLCYWTVTLWRDLPSFQKFVGSGPHVGAMSRASKWSSEASTRRIQWSLDDLPKKSQVVDILRENPKFSILLNPSEAHKS